MSEIKSFSDYTSKYNSNVDYSALFGGTSDSSSVGNTNMLSDYAAIKNGSYGKLMKAYYAKQDAEKLSGKGDTSQKLTLMKTSADSLKKSADALNDTGDATPSPLRFGRCRANVHWTFCTPALATASYPFVDLPSGDTLRCKLLPADKFYKISLYFEGRIKYNEVNEKSGVGGIHYEKDYNRNALHCAGSSLCRMRKER